MLPLRCSGQHSAPWPPSSCARLLRPSSRPVAGVTFDEPGSAELSAAFAASHPVAFNLAVPSPDGGLYDTAFDRFAPVSPGRVLGMHATPLPVDGRAPLAANQPAPGSYSAAPVRLLARAFRLSPADFPRGVSRFPSSGFQPHGSQGHVGQGDHFRRCHLPRAQVCTQPLLIRPAEQPDCLPTSARHPN